MANTNNTNTVVGAASAIGRELIAALPPAFVMLCLINVGFLGMVMWFLTQQMEMRADAWKQMVEHCTEKSRS